MENAKAKGRAVPGECVIACDTVVSLGNEVLGKPYTAKKATEMLKKLSGKTHRVISGLYVRVRGKETICAERSDVTFYTLSDRQIDEYVEKFRPFDKAGAYGIQDGMVVEKYVGSYDNIVGLPTERVKEILSEVE